MRLPWPVRRWLSWRLIEVGLWTTSVFVPWLVATGRALRQPEDGPADVRKWSNVERVVKGKR